MPLPRLRIAHQLSLLIATAVVLAVAVVGSLSFLNLRSGFRDYLQARDDEQLMRFVALVEQHAASDPGLQALRQDPEPLRRLMDEFNGRSGRPEDPQGRPPPPPAPPPRGLGSFGERLFIRDLQGQRLAGRPQPQGAPHITRAVKVRGQEVAMVELTAEPEPEGVDARFLQRQSRRLLWAALGTIALSVLAAMVVAGRWSRPLRTLQQASRDIARGRCVLNLQPQGAREIAELMQDIATMASELQRLEAARKRWIAQISHELRTPLSVLRGELEAIEDGARAPTPTVMASLREEVLQLARLVADLHTLSVADLQGMPCDLQEGDAHEQLWRAAQRFEGQARNRGLQLHLPPKDAPPLPAYWDWGRMEQVVGNLLGNSLRYTDAPGDVWVDWRVDGPVITLTVEDSAPAVAQEDLPELFEPLYRGDRARSRNKAGGSGLGLSIVRAMVQAHQGTVQASLSDRGGLRIEVRVPLRPNPAARPKGTR